MIRASDRVPRGFVRLLHLLGVTATGLLVAASLLLGGIAWRLSLGPIKAGWLLHRLENQVVVGGGNFRVSFDGGELAWEGFHQGVNLPISLRLLHVTLIDPAGGNLLEARRATMSLSLEALLKGRLVPHMIDLEGGVVAVTRDPGGAFNVDLPSLNSPPAASPPIEQSTGLQTILSELVHRTKANSTTGWLDQLRRVRVRDFGLMVHDAQSGVTWRASDIELDLGRPAGGGADGYAHAALSLGDQRADLTLGIDFADTGRRRLRMTLTSLQLAPVSRAAPALSFLSQINAPLSLQATMDFDAAFLPVDSEAHIQIGPGTIKIKDDTVSFQESAVELAGTPSHVVIRNADLRLGRLKAGRTTNLRLSGSIDHQAARLTAAIALALDHQDIVDLVQVWPEGIGPNVRRWIAQNITKGLVTHAAFSLTAESADDLHDVVLTKAVGDLDGSNASFFWIDQVPPIERAQVHLHFVNPDKLVISLTSGHQRISKGGADLLIPDGQMEINGLSHDDQTAAIRTHIVGPLASAITILKEPRLNLLSKLSTDFRDVTGDASATMSLAFPLLNTLRAEDIVVHADAHLSRVQMKHLVAGRDLREGSFDMSVDKDGLTLNGQAFLAFVPVAINGTMDFDAASPGQVFQRITITGQTDAGQLVASGIPVKDVLSSGTISLTAILLEHRNGVGSVALSADLTTSAWAIKPLAWTKPAGARATGSATLLLSNDQLTAVSRIAVNADDFLLRASGDCVDGVVRTLHIDRVSVGKTLMQGIMRFPESAPVAIVASGPQIDLAPRLADSLGHTAPATNEPSSVPDWTLDARFDQALLANGVNAHALSARVEERAGALRAVEVTGSTSASAGFSIHVTKGVDARRLSVEAADAGAFLQGLGLTQAIQSGRLVLDGRYDSVGVDPAITGTARIDDSRVRNVPAMGTALQAMTLYGLADLMRGPGMGISHIVIPFRYQGNVLQITDGRAFSSSLGLTARGSIDTATDRVSVTGTIVPAYFFNSLLGYIPFVGKLFAPEVGGGLFAARYSIEGPLENASVSVNPLSVLTPGALRNLFDIKAANRRPPVD